MSRKLWMTVVVMALVVLAIPAVVSAQEKTVEFEGKKWVIPAGGKAVVEEYKGKQALHISGGKEKSYTYLPGVEFGDGVIEVDIAGGTFTGIGFRGQDVEKYEKLYFRPQNAGTKKHENSVQYTAPGQKGGTWSALRKKFPGKYESGADIKKGEWFHARLEIKGKELKVFVNDAEEPVLVVEEMLHGESKGTVGVWGWNSYFANFKFTPAGFTFVQVCDPHLDENPDFVKRYKQTIIQINKLKPDFVVNCGDSAHRGVAKTLAEFVRLNALLEVPTHSVAGNHDFNPKKGDERCTAERLDVYREHVGKDYYSFHHKGVEFVFVNTALMTSINTKSEVHGVVPFEGRIKEEYDKQDKWIKETLKAQAELKNPVIVVGHQPLHPVMPGMAPGVVDKKTRAEYVALFIKVGVIAVLGGHGHREYIKEHDGIWFVHGNTTSKILDKKNKTKWGYRLWHVKADGTFTHEYVPLDENWKNLDASIPEEEKNLEETPINE